MTTNKAAEALRDALVADLGDGYTAGLVRARLDAIIAAARQPWTPGATSDTGSEASRVKQPTTGTTTTSACGGDGHRSPRDARRIPPARRRPMTPEATLLLAWLDEADAPAWVADGVADALPKIETAIEAEATATLEAEVSRLRGALEVYREWRGSPSHDPERVFPTLADALDRALAAAPAVAPDPAPPAPGERCALCPSTDRLFLGAGWESEVEVKGAGIPIIGCGNPWHYVFPQPEPAP